MKKSMSKKAIQRRRETEERARRAREAESLALERQRRAEFEQRLAAGRAQVLEERRRARLASEPTVPDALGPEGPDRTPSPVPIQLRPSGAPPWRPGALRAMVPFILGLSVGPRDPDKG